MKRNALSNDSELKEEGRSVWLVATLGPFLLLIALGVVFSLIWVWNDIAMALFLGIGAVGILLVVWWWACASGPAGSKPFGPGVST